MANRVYDDQKTSNENLRNITGIGIGEEDQIDAAAKKGARDDIAQREATASLSEKGDLDKEVRPEDISEKEQAGERPRNYKGKHRAEQKIPSYYRGAHRQNASKGVEIPHRRRSKKKFLLLGGGLFGIITFIAVIAVILLYIAPLKNVHFADLLRTVGFARFTYQMNRQFARVVLDASTLTNNATGRFPERSLTNKVLLVNPDRRLAQLGREGHVRWDFEGQQRWFGLRSERNIFHGVTIGGQEYSFDRTARELFSWDYGLLSDHERAILDNRSRDTFGRDYNQLSPDEQQRINSQSRDVIGRDFNELSRAEQRTVKARFGNQIAGAVGASLGTQSWLKRMTVYAEVMRFTRAVPIGWINQGREFLGATPDEARVMNVDERHNRITQDSRGPTSRLTPIAEDAEHRSQQKHEAAREGRSPPGEVRNRVATQLRRAGRASEVVLATTIACVIHDLSRSFGEVEREREERVFRTSNLTMSMADQTKEGDVAPEAVHAENESWNGAEQSPFYRQSIGRPLTVEDTELFHTAPWVNQEAKFANVIQTIDQILFGGPADFIPGVVNLKEKAIRPSCNVLMNEHVQWGIAGAEFVVAVASAGATRGTMAAIRAGVEAGVGIAVGVGLSHWVGMQIDDYIERLSDIDFSGVAVGADKYSENAVAMNYAQQIGTRGINFGKPVDRDEANAIQEAAMADIQEYYRGQPPSVRYFAIDNPFSLTGQLAAITPTSVGGAANSARQGLAAAGSLLTAPARLIGSAFSVFTTNSIAQAAPDPSPGSSFGVEEWGWTPEELARIDSDPNFDTAAPDDDMVMTDDLEANFRTFCARYPQNFQCVVEPRLDELNERYWECYNVEEYTFQADRPERCDRDLLSAGHPEYGDDALYWRHYMATTYAAGLLKGE